VETQWGEVQRKRRKVRRPGGTRGGETNTSAIKRGFVAGQWRGKRPAIRGKKHTSDLGRDGNEG